MQLKLAEYNLKTGKFERFLELGKHLKCFGYFGDEIEICKYPYSPLFKKDEKDPLNRFDGLFNGRTYGNGRFILIINQQDQIVHDHWKDEARSFYIVSENGEAYNIGEIFYSSRTAKELVLAGNLHENPELWEKVR